MQNEFTENPTDSNKILWLKSPLTEKSERLQPMSQLVLRPYYGSKRTVRLIRTVYKIGASEDCDIVLNDPFVSPVHAELKLLPAGGGYSIEDLDSQNGTFLNGVRVVKAPLSSSGTIRIGRSHISWTDSPSDADLDGQTLIAEDAKMLELVSELKKIARSNLPVLLLGETGTGKDVLARMIHAWSPRSNNSFIAINGALTGGNLAESELFGHKKGAYTGSESPRLGALRSAHCGTLFLDEVADIPGSTQAKLLRALESGEVKALGSDAAEKIDFRLISATSQDVHGRVRSGDFRLDLFYRIAGHVIRVPSLRDRPADILAIARKRLAGRGFELDKESEGNLLSHSWPGNVRELIATLEKAMVLARSSSASRILPEHLEKFSYLDPQPQFDEKTQAVSLEELEKKAIRKSLERNGWSRTVVATELGIARSTLFEKMRKYSIRDTIAIAE